MCWCIKTPDVIVFELKLLCAELDCYLARLHRRIRQRVEPCGVRCAFARRRCRCSCWSSYASRYVYQTTDVSRIGMRVTVFFGRLILRVTAGVCYIRTQRHGPYIRKAFVLFALGVGGGAVLLATSSRNTDRNRMRTAILILYSQYSGLKDHPPAARTHVRSFETLYTCTFPQNVDVAAKQSRKVALPGQSDLDRDQTCNPVRPCPHLE